MEIVHSEHKIISDWLKELYDEHAKNPNQLSTGCQKCALGERVKLKDFWSEDFFSKQEWADPPVLIGLTNVQSDQMTEIPSHVRTIF